MAKIIRQETGQTIDEVRTALQTLPTIVVRGAGFATAEGIRMAIAKGVRRPRFGQPSARPTLSR